MRMLEQINFQIQEAELELGQQLLGCKEPYHRLCSLTQRFHHARRSLDKITCHMSREEYHQICENYYFQHNLQKREREMVLHPDPEIQSKHDKVAMIARTFLGDPAGILRDILAIQAYTTIVSLSYTHSIQRLTGWNFRCPSHPACSVQHF
jgi:hypothetical protein